MESYTRWEPASGIASPCADIVLHGDPRSTTVLCRFSEVRGALPRDLAIRFGTDVVASMSHEEFVHPWQRESRGALVPRLEGEWRRYAFPLLEVHDSEWLASFSDGEILEPDRVGLRHFRLVSLDNTVDILARGTPEAEWVAPAI
jgi:hypothetical protein